MNNSKLIKSLFLMYVVGAICGLLFALMVNDGIKSELKSYVDGFLELYPNSEITPSKYFFESVVNYLSTVLVIWVLGASLVGVPMIFVLPVARGFITLFSVMFLSLNYGYDGLWFSLGSIISVEFFFVPVLVLYCAYAVNFSLTMFKIKSGRKYGKRLLRYSGVMLMVVSIITIISLCESHLFTYLLPIFLR